MREKNERKKKMPSIDKENEEDRGKSRAGGKLGTMVARNVHWHKVECWTLHY